jgi:hypothetical protein
MAFYRRIQSWKFGAPLWPSLENKPAPAAKISFSTAKSREFPAAKPSRRPPCSTVANRLPIQALAKSIAVTLNWGSITHSKRGTLYLKSPVYAVIPVSTPMQLPSPWPPLLHPIFHIPTLAKSFPTPAKSSLYYLTFL